MFTKNKLAVLIVSALTAPYPAFGADINNNDQKIVDYQWDLDRKPPTYDMQLNVGKQTEGKLTVVAGGVINSLITKVGQDGGNGEINVTNGGVINTVLLQIGSPGATNSVVNVIDGGIINIAKKDSYNFAHSLTVGGNDNSGGGTGILNISGAGSQVNIGDVGELNIGYKKGEGYINISDGGKLNIADKNGLYIGGRNEGKGTVTVDGTGSELYSQERVLLGIFNDTEGLTFIKNGGKLSTDSYISVGHGLPNGRGELVITGNNSLAQAKENIIIGNGGDGIVVVSDEGKLVAPEIKVANKQNSIGELAIGSRAGEGPVAAGIIDANKIEFGQGKGVVTFNHTNTDYEFNTTISGKGDVQALSGTTVFNKNLDYSGKTYIGDNANFQAGAANVFSANSSHTISVGGILNLNGFNQNIKSLDSNGVVMLSGNSQKVGTELAILNDFSGYGSVYFNTVLGDDSSATDRLAIMGNATGSTTVYVNNLGGKGAQTINGIEIIKVGGTSTDDAFIQGNRIAAGAYEYTLVKGDTIGSVNPNNWYLTSVYNALRPEAGIYTANLDTANNLFTHRLHDRLGQARHIGMSKDDKENIGLWVRQSHSHGQFEDSTAQLKTKTERNMFQVGGDVAQWTTNGHNLFILGAMAGYGTSTSNTDSYITGKHASGQLDGYSVGIYGTYFKNPESQIGLYADSWLLWSQFNASVKGDELAEENYHLKGWTASLELGYAMPLRWTKPDESLWIQPNVQVTWMGVKAYNHVEQNGTVVTGQHDNIQTRVGVRGFTTYQLNTAIPMVLKPFVELNWVNNRNPYGISMDSVFVEQGTRNMGEVKVGVEANINRSTDLWLNLEHRAGSNAYRNTAVLAGLRYSF